MDKTKFFTGYLLVFFGIFLLSIIYPMASTYISNISELNMPQNTYTAAMNSTSGIQSMSSSLGLLGIVVLIGIITSVLICSFGGIRMSSAI